MNSKDFLKIVLLSVVIFASSCKQEENTSFDSIDGNWSCSETSSEFGMQQYDVKITRDSQDTTKYYFDNFYQLGSGIKTYGYLDEYSVTIPTQIVDGQTLNGTGEVSGSFKSISLTYTADDGGGVIDNISATYTLQ